MTDLYDHLWNLDNISLNNICYTSNKRLKYGTAIKIIRT